MAWAQNNSVDTSKVTTAFNISTDTPILVAARDMPAGEAVLSVPEAAWISPAVVQRSRMGKLVEGMEPWLQLTLYVLAESAAPGSAAAPYVAGVMSSPDTPLLWAEEELTLLRGTQLLENLEAYK